jgi:signal transduction histidine kinase
MPSPSASTLEQATALQDWSVRLRMPLALDDENGQRISASESFARRQAEPGPRALPIRLSDGRTLWVMRPGGLRLRDGPRGQPGPRRPHPEPEGLSLPFLPPDWQRGAGLAVLLLVLLLAISAGAYPVVRRLTRRLEALKQGVEQFGAGNLQQRVEETGRDEVAAVARSFNQAAAKVEVLVRSHQSLLANASHELRSPLARMKMAVAMLDAAPPARRESLKREIETNVAELDALVEEVLLASRLDASQTEVARDPVDVLALVAEEAARVNASVDGVNLSVRGDERLLRRAVRNLLENARRYGGGDVAVELTRSGAQAQLKVCDRGPGVPPELRERIFEAFYRLPGHAEQAGGVGLGLSLVRQIAQRHGGTVVCLAREGGGSCFALTLPV